MAGIGVPADSVDVEQAASSSIDAISACAVISDEAGPSSQELISACPSISDEAGPSNQESISACPVISDEAGPSDQESISASPVISDEAGSSSQESVPAGSFDADQAGSSSHGADLDECYANDNCKEEDYEKVRQKLIETGQMDRLKDFTERRLSEVGWRAEMMTKCREIVAKHGSKTTFEMLFQPLRQYGKDIVPPEIKEDVLQKIKYCYESETKEDGSHKNA